MNNEPTLSSSELAPYGAVDPDWYATQVAEDPWMFHVTHRRNLPAIREHGLRPILDGSVMQSHPSVGPNRAAVYLGSRDLARDGWLHEWTDLHDLHAAVVAVDMRLVDLDRIIPDEDALAGTITDVGIDPSDYGVPPFSSKWDDPGCWSLDVQLGAQPGVVEACWAERGTVAHIGRIPVDALRIDVTVPRSGDPDGQQIEPWWFHYDKLRCFEKNPELVCVDAALEVVETLIDHHVPGRLVQVHGHPADPHQAHIAVEAAGVVIDLTFGQFDRSAPWPLIEPAADYAARFSGELLPVNAADAFGEQEAVDIVSGWADRGLHHS